MAKHILYCKKCKNYTLEENCPECNEQTFERKPAKYSPEDKYGRFRREIKEQEYKEKGLL